MFVIYEIFRSVHYIIYELIELGVIRMENEMVSKECITSLELLEQVNIFREKDSKTKLAHNTFMRTIRDEFDEEIRLNKIVQSSYINSQNKEQPMFVLTLPQAKQVLVRESKFVRKAVIHYIETLENKVKEQQYQLSQVERLRLQLFSDNKFEVIEAHKQLIDLEKAPLIEKIEELEPQADNWKKYMDSDNTITVTDLARIIEPNRKQIFEMLREQGLVCQHKALPTMKGIDKGLLVQKFMSNGYPTARITVKGVEYIINYFKGQD